MSKSSDCTYIINIFFTSGNYTQICLLRYSLHRNKIKISMVIWGTSLVDYKAEIQMFTFYGPDSRGEIFTLGIF